MIKEFEGIKPTLGEQILLPYITVGYNAIIHGCTIEDHCLIGMGQLSLTFLLIPW
jgi:carbonic anhydrase/acetyltransferase-like protein (isoleucine patch superfamily)